jgi:hypothetical protein
MVYATPDDNLISAVKTKLGIKDAPAAPAAGGGTTPRR